MSKKPRAKKTADFPYAIRSFLGYLEGTSKALHTIKNYRLDILSFHRFLLEGAGKNAVQLENIELADVERYHDWLKAQGLKNNTRRRKLLTVQKFLNYLAHRNRAPGEIARKYPTPHKIERIPLIVPLAELLSAIRVLPTETLLDARNRVMLWTMAETGCLVSELTRLKYENFSSNPLSVEILGKSPRKLQISEPLFDALNELKVKASGQQRECPWAFPGFNKFGSLGSPITPRGVEILVKLYAPRLGFPELTPRTFRHSAVIHWSEEGCPQKDIQERLGLKTSYAFRVYDVMLKARERNTQV